MSKMKLYIKILIMYLIVSCTNATNEKKTDKQLVSLGEKGDTLFVANRTEKGVLDGEFKRYAKNKIDSVYHYTNGIKSGEYKIYFSDGGIKEIGNLKHGEPIGWTRCYYTNGNLYSKIEYGPGPEG